MCVLSVQTLIVKSPIVRKTPAINVSHSHMCIFVELIIMVYRHRLLPRLFERDNDVHQVRDPFGVFLRYSRVLRASPDRLQNIIRHCRACALQTWQQHVYRRDSCL